MEESTTVPATMLKFSGTPTAIGGQIWERMCLPAIAAVGNDQPPQVLAQLYGGFMLAAWGAMVADFGPIVAIDLSRQLLAKFEEMAATLDQEPRVQ